MKNYSIISREYMLLESLFIQQWHVNHDSATPDFGYLLAELDKLHVPWWLQNAVAFAAEKRELIFQRGFQRILSDILAD